MNINDYRRRSARSEMELKALLRPHASEAWHLSPEDSPDLLVRDNVGRFVFIEAKAIQKDSFDMRRDPDTIKQHDRLEHLAAQGESVWYAIKFMHHGWKFYKLPRLADERSLRLNDEQAYSLAQFTAMLQAGVA
jgi:Holliday junction resolvase